MCFQVREGVVGGVGGGGVGGCAFAACWGGFCEGVVGFIFAAGGGRAEGAEDGACGGKVLAEGEGAEGECHDVAGAG